MLWRKFSSSVVQLAALSLGIRWEIPPDAEWFHCQFHPNLTEYIETLLYCVCLFIFQSPQFVDKHNEIIYLFVYF